MSFIYVNAVIHGRRGKRELRMIVDTGSEYVILNEKIIKELDLIETPYTVELTLADGRKIKAKMYIAEIELRGRKAPIPVLALNTSTPILGLNALASLGFKVNPRTKDLEIMSKED